MTLHCTQDTPHSILVRVPNPTRPLYTLRPPQAYGITVVPAGHRCWSRAKVGRSAQPPSGAGAPSPFTTRSGPNLPSLLPAVIARENILPEKLLVDSFSTCRLAPYDRCLLKHSPVRQTAHACSLQARCRITAIVGIDWQSSRDIAHTGRHGER